MLKTPHYESGQIGPAIKKRILDLYLMLDCKPAHIRLSSDTKRGECRAVMEYGPAHSDLAIHIHPKDFFDYYEWAWQEARKYVQSIPEHAPYPTLQPMILGIPVVGIEDYEWRRTMKNLIVVPPGQEQQAAEALAGPGVRKDPDCPECGSQRASRISINRENPQDVHFTPCYLDLLDWERRKGLSPRAVVIDAYYHKFPRGRFNFTPHWANPDRKPRRARPGMTSNYSNAGVRCDHCGYCGPSADFWNED